MVLPERWWEQLQYAMTAAFFNVFSMPQRAKYRKASATPGPGGQRL